MAASGRRVHSPPGESASANTRPLSLSAANIARVTACRGCANRTPRDWPGWIHRVLSIPEYRSPYPPDFWHAGRMISAAWVALAIVGYVLVLGGIVWWSYRRAAAGTPRHVIRKLRANAAPFHVRIGILGGVWNPAKPLGRSNPVWGPGRATYWLDQGDAVHLRFDPRWGKAMELSGRVPESLPTEAPAQQHQRQLVHRIILGYCAFLILGLVLGYFVGRGSTAAHLVGAVVGLLVAMAVAWFVGHVLQIGAAVRKVAARQATDQPGSS